MEEVFNIAQNNLVALALILFILFVIALFIFIYKKNFSKNIIIIKDDNGKNIRLEEFATTYKNGSLKSKYYLFKKKKHYKEFFYFKSGEINKIQNWQNGSLEGESKTYYKSGELYILSNYKDGKLDGEYIVYGKDGSVIHKYKYNHGELINE